MLSQLSGCQVSLLDLISTKHPLRSALERFEKNVGEYFQQTCPAVANPKVPKNSHTCSNDEWLENFKIPHGDRCRQDHHTIFVTTKVWPPLSSQKVQGTVQKFFNECGRSQIDLLVLHWPALPERFGGLAEEAKDAQGNLKRRLEAWKQLEIEYAAGRVRAIGVSNFMRSHLDSLIADIEKRRNEGDSNATMPAVDQIEISPWLLPPSDLMEICNKHKITLQGYSPLGAAKHVTQMLSDPVINELAAKHQKTPAQLIIRSLIERGFLTIPKSANADRIRANYNVFDFTLDPSDLQELEDKVATGLRTCPDPNQLA
eukprot:Protomagalhaensia_wolfi_Nauph_80__1297@NODE_1771_length_1349_cov_182_387023_g1379_i0_p1_GENE_NODE_1771_length_1349_cov_182_387023_g1379_i0NODE_1771_length_1349_cov_182_387023_g1379_i0_p1_ORF_typecomplete_len315_score57_05Aldo_ket_red/PF00248_21/1_8e39Antifungal_prot/PF11402_8/0_19Antifungal_prot/PF11402_8/6_6e03_NODE_1771_length_1349_cov_182_387023_g1379_i01971141